MSKFKPPKQEDAKKYIEGEKFSAPPEPILSQSEAAALGYAQGGSMGLADRGAAFMQWLLQGKDYNIALENLRALRKYAERKYPATTTTGEVAGALLSSPLGVKSRLGQAGFSAAQGGIMGAATAPEGQVLERAALGTGIGAVAPSVVEGVGKGLKFVGQKAAPFLESALIAKPGYIATGVPEDTIKAVLKRNKPFNKDVTVENLRKQLSLDDGQASAISKVLENLGNKRMNIDKGIEELGIKIDKKSLTGLMNEALDQVTRGTPLLPKEEAFLGQAVKDLQAVFRKMAGKKGTISGTDIRNFNRAVKKFADFDKASPMEVKTTSAFANALYGTINKGVKEQLSEIEGGEAVLKQWDELADLTPASVLLQKMMRGKADPSTKFSSAINSIKQTVKYDTREGNNFLRGLKQIDDELGTDYADQIIEIALKEGLQSTAFEGIGGRFARAYTAPLLEGGLKAALATKPKVKMGADWATKITDPLNKELSINQYLLQQLDESKRKEMRKEE